MKTVSIYLLMGMVLGLLGCAEDSAKTKVSGILQAVQQGTALSADNPPLVTIAGRLANEFNYLIGSQGSTNAQLNFVLENAPKDQDLVFEISGPMFEKIISFPQNTSASVRLPVLVAESISAFIQLAEDSSGDVDITVNTSLGIVAGILQPSFGGGVVTVGGTTASVRMVEKNSDDVVVYAGPFYFNGVGNLVDSGSCPDSECNYIFFNVPPGSYRFQQLDSNEQVLVQRDVLVLASSLTFGID